MGTKGGTERFFSKKYKLAAVKKNIEGESSGKLSKELGLEKSLICHWREYTETKVKLGWKRRGMQVILFKYE